MVCTLCLKDIKDGEETVTVNGKLRHKECSDSLEEMISDLEKISMEDNEPDI